MYKDETKQKERIDVHVFPTADEACTQLAVQIKELIQSREASGEKTVLGLATGSTPVRLYGKLIQLHREEGLSFKHVITFNLDEYYGLGPEHPESYARFMREQLFEHIDIDPSHCHIPDGTLDRKKIHQHCLDYESKIEACGGIDLQILGIGRTGHIGFNEPGSTAQSMTRLVTLDTITRRDAARDFLGEEKVPFYAITMGVGTILNAKKIVLLAWGENKAAAVRKAVEGSSTPALPASFLQTHKECRFLVDENAAGELTRFKHPWKVGPVDWSPERIHQAVVWLATLLQKPILKLTEENYSENSLAELLTEKGPAYDLNIHIFNQTQKTITGWPGGKPNADDSNRPERAGPHPKKIVVFSPEPGNAVIGMGATINRLVKQGHEVNLCFLTSGNLAVEDEDALKYIRFALDFQKLHQEGETPDDNFIHAESILNEIENKNPFELDSPTVRRVKGLIRKGEAITSLKTCALPQDCVTSLDLPFYNRGRYRRFHPEEEDISSIFDYLEQKVPHSIFITGRKSDPSSLQALGFNLFTRPFERLAGNAWISECRVWIYPAETVTFEPHEIDMSVPLSPSELKLKIRAISQHQTQRTQSPSMNNEQGEIWNITGTKNRNTAEIYDQLGLAEYEAMEVFQRWV